jgi:hypothetical protein
MRADGRIRRGLVVVALVAAVCSAAGTASAEEASDPALAAQVDVAPYAKELQRGSIRIAFTARCRAGTEVQELSLTYTQGGTEYGEAIRPAQLPSLVCDGAWHRIRWTTIEAFEPGAVQVFARLTVIDSTTGDPLPQALDDQRVWVKPAAKVAIASPATLLAGGDALVKVSYTCDQPWVDPGLSIELRQDGGTVGGNAFVGDGLRCDDRWHAVWMRVSPGNTVFHVGAAEATASLDIYDPVSFDPVTQARLTKAIRLQR